ncbi:MAG: polyprenyl diphosphate synthase [Candidatus Hadarchaeota archaeon]|nr:polyprenyl diphosphate synthase [Candidatus Hadarchaeota archaeon]
MERTRKKLKEIIKRPRRRLVKMHLGIIPDGNRRWARENNLAIIEGHRKGAEKMKEFLRWASEEKNIDEVSVYALSLENLVKRDRAELENLFNIFEQYFTRMVDDDWIDNYDVEVRFQGKTFKLPKGVQSAIQKVVKATRNHSSMVVNMLLPYSGRDEIINAIKGILESGVGKITEKILKGFLWISEPVDLIIRTGKERRLSNFLIYQGAYAEIVYVDKYWPDFERSDLDGAMKEFKQRERRRGE